MHGIAIAAIVSFATTGILLLVARRRRPSAATAVLTFLAGAAIGYTLTLPILLIANLSGFDPPGFQFGGTYYGGSLLVVAATSIVATVLVFLICRRIEDRRPRD